MTPRKQPTSSHGEPRPKEAPRKMTVTLTPAEEDPNAAQPGTMTVALHRPPGMELYYARSLETGAEAIIATKRQVRRRRRAK